MPLSTTLLTENSFQTLSWDEKFQIFYINFHPTSLYTPLTQLTLEVDRLVRTLNTLKPRAILVDARELALTLGVEEQAAVLHAAKNNVLHVRPQLAILEAKDLFVQVGLHQLLTDLGLSTKDFGFFQTPQEAEAWLA